MREKTTMTAKELLSRSEAIDDCDDCYLSERTSCKELLQGAARMLVTQSGTSMSQDEYNDLAETSFTNHLSDAEALVFINRNFGFETSRIKLIIAAATYRQDGIYVAIDKTYAREQLYASSDWNYLHFKVEGWEYECVNGELQFYWD